MVLQFASDLHLEFTENRRYLDIHPLQPAADILILAGDILPLRLVDERKTFFDQLSGSYQQVYWIAGNHEFYDFDIANKLGTFHEKIRTNVSLLNNVTIELRNCILYFSTLWSQISKENAFWIERRLSDFYQIRVEGSRFSTEVYNHMHHNALTFLEHALRNKSQDSKTRLIVSHHVPTLQNYPHKYLGNTLNEAFATDLDEFIRNSAVDYWIYGHHHALTPEFKIGITKLVTNQLGYVFSNEHRRFDRAKVLHL